MSDTASSPVGKRIVVFSARDMPGLALHDLVNGLLKYEVWSTFAMHDIRQRFRRSALGPFWLTLTMGIMVGALGVVFSAIFQQDVGLLLPHIATGIIFWGLFTTSITEGATVFTSAEGYIRNVPLPISTHFYRLLARNVIIWAFNMAIYVAVIVFFPQPANANYLLAIPGFALLLVNTAWVTLLAGTLSARYRDIPQVIANVVQVVFFLTPVFWTPDNLPTRPAFVDWNPFYHLLEVVRRPLLGEVPEPMSWVVTIGLAVVGCVLALLVYQRAYSRIPYWI